MKFRNLSLVVLLFILLSSCSDNLIENKAESVNETINIVSSESNQTLIRVWLDEFKSELSKNDYILIDLRTSGELIDTWIISWAIQIDFYASDFKLQLDSLDKDKKYLMYCRSWSRSGQALSVMKTLGFTNVVELEWWINMWLNWWENTEQFINN
jgi:rhodanese-related sulfurtransferase